VVLDSNNEAIHTIVFSEEQEQEQEQEQPLSGSLITYSDQQIHPDDTIQLIKKKFLKEYTKIKQISYEEIYIFSRILRTMPTELLFQSIADPATNTVSNQILRQVLSNLDMNLDLLATFPETIKYEEFVTLLGGKNVVDLQYKIPLDKKFQFKYDRCNLPGNLPFCKNQRSHSPECYYGQRIKTENK
jgi:hypothetical protein